MASVFTYDPDPPRVSSPWSTPDSTTPLRKRSSTTLNGSYQRSEQLDSRGDPNFLAECGITKLDPEPQEGPTEYKLHLLLRPRRAFLSLSTGNITSGSSHSRSNLAVSATSQDIPEMAPRPAQCPSNQSRQHRLHQLTTQLLWRLQQSSPFHSSSAANLVLPVLPEATPTLKVPPTRSPLLPGLEESQGALYEIGVSDDGSFVGLTEDELNESLINLEAMAASLGCKVEVLRKIAVGYGEWASEDPVNVQSGKLWVAEALVSADLKPPTLEDDPHLESAGSLGPRPDRGLSSQVKPTEQLHVAIAGPAGAGKSSLLGILSTSALDNGRGKSRLSLLKHRHEIASGVTSSIAQELIGYSAQTQPDSTGGKPDVLNYAAGNIASWNDIHASAGGGGRLVFLSDLPGSLRYSKSALRGLVSWRPDYVLLCVPASAPEGPESADPSQVDISLAYLELCVKLELPVIVVLTKLDAATRSVMKETLARILTAIKSTAREPIMLPASADIAEQNLNLQHISGTDDRDVHSASSATGAQGTGKVPILVTSAVSGAGIGKLHALLRRLSLPKVRPTESSVLDGSLIERAPGTRKEFDINEVFEMPLFKVYSISNENKRKNDRGIILCGRVRNGTISVGDRLVVGPVSQDPRSESDSHPQTTSRQRATAGKAYSEDVLSLRLRNMEASLPPSLSRQYYWQEVRVVSVRNLRLPVKGLSEHQIGTIGVDLVGSVSCLGKIRKGMLLADYGFSPSSPPSESGLSPPRPPSPSFHAGFIAAFPSAHFANTSSPSLVMGGNAMAYIGSVRAAVKLVSAESSGNGQSIPSSMKEPDIFTLDDAALDTEDPALTNGLDMQQNFIPGTGLSVPSEDDIRICFSFVSSVEWIDVGSRVLVMPASLTNMSGSYGLQGFVGRVCDVLS